MYLFAESKSNSKANLQLVMRTVVAAVSMKGD